jgi:hypothetical protein
VDGCILPGGALGNSEPAAGFVLPETDLRASNTAAFETAFGDVLVGPDRLPEITLLLFPVPLEPSRPVETCGEVERI